MNVKQDEATEGLFVRVPASLKHLLRHAARSHQRSVAAEITSILRDHLKYGVSYEIQREADTSLLQMRDFWINVMEMQLLYISEERDAEQAMLKLAELRSQIERSRSLRETEQKAIKARKAERQEARKNECLEGIDVGAGLFSALGEVKPGSRKPTQLDVAERRRENLAAELLLRRSNGDKKQIAEKLGWSRPRVSQILSPPSKAGHRKITGDVARSIEAALGMTPGSLDAVERDAEAAKMKVLLDGLAKSVVQVKKKLGVR